MSRPPNESAVQSVQTSLIRIPLPRPLNVGTDVITWREYTLVRVRANDGIVGKAYCLSRNAPLSSIVHDLLEPHVIGQNTDDVESIWRRMFRGSAVVGRVGLVRKAIGLVDVALWDIAAQRAGVPLWMLLGNDDRPRPVMLVSAYTSPDRTAQQTAAELLAAADSGWPLLKVTRSPDNLFMRELFAILDDKLPSGARIVVDANFGWHSPQQAIADVGAWSPPSLAWLEDPLLPEEIAACAQVRTGTGQRVGVGDEVTDPAVFDGLIAANAIDVLRLDVIAIGGITPAREVMRKGREAGLTISCHVYPEITVHLGADIETFARGQAGNPYDPLPTIVAGGPEFELGSATPPRAPGLGFDICPERSPSARVRTGRAPNRR